MATVRRVRRVVRKIDPWTVLKVSLVFNAVLGLAFVLGVVIFWSVIVNAGIPQAISEVGEKLTIPIRIDGERYFRAVVFLGVVWTVMTTGLMTLAAVLYNLISDVVGGLEIVVLEETLVAPQSSPSPVRPAQSWAPGRRRRREEEERRRADLPTEQTSRVG